MKTFDKDGLCVTAQELYQQRGLDAFCAQDAPEKPRALRKLYASMKETNNA